MSFQLPPHIDADSAPFWEALKRHEVCVQRCLGCGTLRFPPRSICPRCRATAHEWFKTSGRARVLSWTVTHNRFVKQFGEVPYTAVLVELEEQHGLAMYGNLVGESDRLSVGADLGAEFEDVSTEFTLVNWRLSSTDEDRPARILTADLPVMT